MNKHLIIGTAGHVDHGKTALIKALTDIDCDTHKEEKERGITINLGFSHILLPNGDSLGIIDVPGHKDFIKTMVAGAFGIDVFLLVIAADSGVMPQTKEHLSIIKILGIKKGVVALTKSDLVDDDLIELAQEEVSEFLFDNEFADIPIIPVSSITKKGIDELISNLNQLVNDLPEKTLDDFFRLYIDRIFNVKGFGHVVTGSVLNGSIKKGKEVYMLPGSKKYRIKNIERHGHSTEMITCGDRAALNISDLKLQDFKRGMILSDKPLEVTSMIDVSLSLFNINTQLKIWSNVIFLCGTFECMAKIHLLDKDFLQANDTAIAQIHLEKPFVLVNKDKFVIRNSSNTLTLGGGTVFDIRPLHHKRRTAKLIDELKFFVDAAIKSDNFYNLIRLELSKYRGPVLAKTIAQSLNVSEIDMLAEFESSNDGEIISINIDGRNILLNKAFDKNIIAKILAVVKEWHEQSPLLREGMSVKEVADKLGLNNPTEISYLDSKLLALQKEDLLEKIGNKWLLKDFEVKIDPRTMEQLDWLREILKRSSIDKITVDDISSKAQELGINKKRLLMMMKYLESQSEIIHYEGDYMHLDNFNKTKKLILSELLKNERGINEKEFRLLIGSTKKTVKFFIGTLSKDNLIRKETFYIHITDAGRKQI